MAINTFTFGNVTSSTYGIYVSGEGLFNAPKRSTEVVEIPGRDGAYILDKGNFENIEVTYRVFNQEKDLTDFRTKLANLRSALCSQVGYQRLTDTFHPDEYRMAAFVDGVEVNPIKYNTASEFEITFNCKPQRFLTSGETAVSVANNGTITNPTLFEAKPQLQVKGYGAIGFGGSEIIIDNVPLGLIKVGNAINISRSGNSYTYSQSINLTNVETGDEIYSNEKKVNFTLSLSSSAGPFTSFNITSTTKCSASVVFGNYSATVSVTMDDCTFQKGTSITEEATVSFSFVHQSTTTTGTLTIQTVYGGSSTLNHYVNCTNYNYMSESFVMRVPDAYADSTKTATGNPLYIDLDIGEAWNEDSGTPVSLNNAVQLPAELPTLPSGATTITYDNTITSFKVLPRWWKV